MEINKNEINSVFKLDEIRRIKKLAVNKREYELAAYARDREKYLISIEEKRRLRRDKLQRIFLSDK